jgi:hypothetical protein
MVLLHLWSSVKRCHRRREPMTRKPHGAAQTATRTNIGHDNSQNVCSYLLNTSAVVLLYAEDAARRPVTMRRRPTI